MVLTLQKRHQDKIFDCRKEHVQCYIMSVLQLLFHCFHINALSFENERGKNNFSQNANFSLVHVWFLMPFPAVYYRDLRSNNLTRLHSGIFSGLKHLELLWVRWNFFYQYRMRGINSSVVPQAFLSFKNTIFTPKSKQLTLLSLKLIIKLFQPKILQNLWKFSIESYCKVTNFRPVPIFVLLIWNWFVRINFRTFQGLKTNNYIEIRWPQDKNKFLSGIKFCTLFKSTKVRN